MPTVYHYTNKAGYDAITTTGFIAKSRYAVRDAIHGDGVYLTHFSQENDKVMVAKKCWGTAYKSALANGKLDYVIEIDIPMNKLQPKLEGMYLYEEELILGKYRHSCRKCKWKNDGM